MVEICHLHTRAVDERLGNGQGQRKDVALADLNVDNAEVVSTDGIERAEQLGSRLDGDKAICGNFALCNGIGNGTAQSSDILNGVERDATALIQAQQAAQRDGSVLEIAYGNSHHILHSLIEDFRNLLCVFRTGDFGYRLCTQRTDFVQVHRVEGARSAACIAICLQSGNLAILLSCKRELLLNGCNNAVYQTLEAVRQFTVLGN